MTTAGLYASAPIFGRLILGFIAGMASDFIRRKNLMSVALTRKSTLLLSHIIPGLMLIIMCYTGENTGVILTILIIGLSIIAVKKLAR